MPEINKGSSIEDVVIGLYEIGSELTEYIYTLADKGSIPVKN